MPALCIATILVRIAIVMRRRRNERTKFGRAAASELRNLRTAIRRSKTMPFEVLGDASASVRKIVAHLLRSDNTTLSSVEVSSKLAHKGIDEATAKPLTAEMKRLEELPYIKSEEQAKVAGEIRPLLISLEARLVNLATRLEKQKENKAATDWRAMVLILSFIAASSIPVYGDGLFSREPNAFQWEKAQNLMSRAQNEEDFAIASIQYNSMITNGASSGPLFYNFGTALLMEGKPLLAINALDQAAIYLGYSPEVKGNRVLAEKLYSGMETLPTSKYLLYLHYGLPVSDRMLYLLFAWNLA